MRVVAAIGVIDEVECLQACVDHHRRLGIQGFVITDLGSTDGTERVIEQLSRQPDVRVLAGRQDLQEIDWPSSMQRCAYETFRPDYIVYIDPDEFWLPAGGRLDRDWTADIIAVRRYNVVPDERLLRGDWALDGPFERRIVFRERLAFTPEVLDDHRTPVIRFAPGPKVIHRAVPAAIERGWHAAASPELQSRICPDDVVVLHFLISTWDRFARKVRNARYYLEANRNQLGTTEAWHWRIWTRALDEGLLRECYDNQVFTTEQIAAFLLEGIACPAGDLFRSQSR